MLHDILIVTRKEVIDIIQHRASILLALATTIYLGFFSPIRMLHTLSALLGGIQPATDLYLVVFYVTTGLVMSWGLTTVSSFTAEKARIETLLTTPLVLHAVWLGRTAAVFLFCYITASVCALGFIIYVNAALHSLDTIVLPSLIGGIASLFCPLVIFEMTAINNLIQLISDQLRISQFMYFGIIFLLYRTGINLGVSLSNSVILGYATVVLILFLTIIVLARILTKEKIVLSLG